MSDAKKDNAKTGRQAIGNKQQTPGWANGLKRLYDSVVEEELPDSFKDLLSRLDDDQK